MDYFCNDVTKQADFSSGDGQVQRVLKRFAIAALAGELATKADLTGWPSGAARAAARGLFPEWTEAREGTTNQEIATHVKLSVRFSDNLVAGAGRFDLILFVGGTSFQVVATG